MTAMEYSAETIDVSTLQFVFDNIIKVVQTRAAFLQFLEHYDLENLLLFYESITYLLRRLNKFVQEFSKTADKTVSPRYYTAARSLSMVSTLSSSNKFDKSILRKNSESSSSFSNLRSYSFSLMKPDDFIFELDVLVGKYLLDQSPQEIKLFLSERANTVSAIENWKKNVPRDSFSTENVSALQSALVEYITLLYEKMHYELYPKFLKSDLWSNFWLKFTNEEEKIALLQKIAQKKLEKGGSQKVVYTFEEFVTEPIREKDFLFLFQLLHDKENIWKPVHENYGDKYKSSIFKSSFQFLADKPEQETLFFKIVGHLPYFVDDIACYLLTGKFLKQVEFHDFQFQHLEVITPKVDFLQEDMLSMPASCTINRIFQNSVAKKKEYIISSSLRTLHHLDQYLFVSKTCDHAQFPSSPKNNRSNYISGLSIQRVSNAESRFVYCALLPLKGVLAKTNMYIKSQIEHRAKLIHQLLHKHLQEHTLLLRDAKMEEVNLNEHDKYFGLHKVLQWNRSNMRHSQQLYSAISFENDIFDLRKLEFRKLGVRL